jgi:hypothetical protein
MTPFAAWILSLLVYLAPPDKLAALPQLPGWHETAAQKLERYGSIAADVGAVAEELEPKSPRRAAVLLVALAFMEGGLAADVDTGPCYRPLLSSPRCDGGAAFSLWQIRLGAGSTSEGWTGADLQGDRRKAARVALRMAWRSIRACSRRGHDAGLRAYASGSCDRGQEASAARLDLARRLLQRFPAPSSTATSSPGT